MERRATGLLGKEVNLPRHLGENAAIGRWLEGGIASAFDFFMT